MIMKKSVNLLLASIALISLVFFSFKSFKTPYTIFRAVFSPDGTRLATAGRDGTVRIFLLKIEELIALANSRVTRSLTTAECQQYLHVDACPVQP